MTLSSRPQCRAGLSLLEVLTALAIFLVAMVAVGQMINMATDSAVQVEHQQLAAQLCQAKIAEVNAGAISPTSSQSDAAMGDDFPGWTWSMESEQGDVANLYRVKVRVGRDGPNGTRIECEMNQMVLDPAVRGNASDNPATPTGSADTATAASGSSSSNSGGSSGSSGGSGSSGSSGGSSNSATKPTSSSSQGSSGTSQPWPSGSSVTKPTTSAPSSTNPSGSSSTKGGNR